MVITAFEFALIFVMVQIVIGPFSMVSPVWFAPVMLTVVMYSKPSGKLSVTVKMST